MNDGAPPDGRLADARRDLVAFAHALRGAGLGIGTGQVVALVESAAALSPVGLTDLYWVARATLVHDPAQIPVFERVFRAWFEGELPEEPISERLDEPDSPVAFLDPDGPESAPGEAHDPEVVGAVASDRHRLRKRRFDRASPRELALMRHLMASIELSLPRRRSRRRRRAWHPGEIDLRRSLRRALQTDGELIERRWTERRLKPRRLVLLLDISGSMAGFSRALLQFAFAARTNAPSVEVFAFATRVTRVTRQLGRPSVDLALDAAAAEVDDWHGGTRIGNAVEALMSGDAARLTRGAVVLICSDGLERDDPRRLGAAMARLRRSAHAVVWVNPLKGDDRYEPSARGMRAALPHVDRFVAGHDLASLEDLAAVVRGLGQAPRPVAPGWSPREPVPG